VAGAGVEVTDREAPAVVDIPAGETVPDVPERMLQFFGLDG
jgi:hypothetical protein